MTVRRSALAITAALALATAGGCGDDNADDGGGGQSDSPVNTQTPQQSPSETPAPNSRQSSKGE